MADNYEFIKCPACGALMKKVFLEKHQFIVDVCLDGCGGIWLDNREFSKIDEKHEDITELNEAYEGLNFDKASEFRNMDERECPICHVKMVKNPVSAKQEILIDECYTCGGKFLDYGELDKIRNEFENDEERTQAALETFKSLQRDRLRDGIINSNEM